MTSLNQQIGARAAYIRDQRGLTLRQVSAALAHIGVNLSYVSLSRLEAGSQTWSVPHVENLAKVYGVDPAAFFVDVEEQSLLRALRTGGHLGVVQWLAQHMGKTP